MKRRFVLSLLSPASIMAAGTIPKKPIDQLKDIKPLIEIPDHSIYIYYGLISIAIMIFIFFIYILVKRLLSMKKKNKAKEYLEVLNNISWNGSKKAAYQITKYGRLLATDDRRKELFTQLLPLLEKYKYKKEVEKIDDETINQFKLYKKVCNESI